MELVGSNEMDATEAPALLSLRRLTNKGRSNEIIPSLFLVVWYTGKDAYQQPPDTWHALVLVEQRPEAIAVFNPVDLNCV